MEKVEAIQNNLNSGKSLRINGHIDVEERGASSAFKRLAAL